VQIDLLLRMYRTMLTIRQFERASVRLLQQGLVIGSVHVCTGQEAVAAGVCLALNQDDYLTTHHRGHGHCIAKGMKLNGMMAEMMGRETGCCKGRGGSMHVADLSIGILGADGVVAGGVPMTVGAALSARLRGTKQVAVAFFGDGAINAGQFHEAMNLAAVWKLPVLFVCDNNQYAISTPVADATAGNLTLRAKGYGIPGRQVDGNDAISVYEATQEALEHARSGAGPSVIEALTYRWEGHSRNDPGTEYRTREEIEAWKTRDPIARLGARLLEQKLATEPALAEIEQAVRRDIDAAVEFAKASPFPQAESVLDFNYA